ncbi:hypothetical protein [Haloarchaeobius sp. HME9146]|uniref:hypothetical protein n=1 Tax=Haloarchaeobius sp. HME9146 TaxID=2978732 RepID=UPI0021C239D2|nr:hypothetical protein [Haloarchaeobius sp. HME9146]MCT9095252.1 hypothetical protein [Haloarchaeobius sp. HME9146]
MLQERGSELADYCERRAGEYHRGTLVYDDDGFELVRVRDDLHHLFGADVVGKVVAHLRHLHRLEDERPEIPGLGEFESGVYAFAESIVIHFALDDGQGVVVALDPEAGSQLMGFVRECRQVLQSMSTA